ncbi:MAG: fructosamine kinase family protein [Cellvibrionaceae bacterium]
MLQPSLKSINQLFEHALTEQPVSGAERWQIQHYDKIQGGDTHNSYLLHSSGPDFFLKLNERGKTCLFTSEAHALNAILATQTLRTCRPLCTGQNQGFSYLLLEGFQLESDGDWRAAGEQLAQMHLASAPDYYGFDHPSYCGKTYQPGDSSHCWADFFAQHRIGHQLALLRGKKHSDPEVQTAQEVIRHQLAHHNPAPALVHGDLWRGNMGFHRGQPVVFDPACYYGDPETDLAMTELFGRLPEDFYRGYDAYRPIDQGYDQRRSIYQLYHLLNHANLMGGQYRQQAEQALKQLIH